MENRFRQTVSFDKDVEEGLFAQRMKQENVRKSISQLVNELLRKALEVDRNADNKETD